MKIKAINYNVYGHFQGTSFDFSSGINVVYGPNEAGKTTLYDSLVTLLYGFRPANRDKHLYVNWTAQKIHFLSTIECNRELFTVERRLTSAPQWYCTHVAKQTVEKGRNEALPETEGISEPLYRGVFHLNTQSLDALEKMTWREIETHLVYDYGAEYLNAPSVVVGELTQDLHKLWRPDKRGQPRIFELEKQLYECERHYQSQLRAYNAAYSARQEADRLTAASEALSSELTQIRREKAEYERYREAYTLQLRCRELEKKCHKPEAYNPDLLAAYEQMASAKDAIGKSEAQLRVQQLKASLESLYRGATGNLLTGERLQAVSKVSVERVGKLAVHRKQLQIIAAVCFALSALMVLFSRPLATAAVALAALVNAFLYWRYKTALKNTFSSCPECALKPPAHFLAWFETFSAQYAELEGILSKAPKVDAAQQAAYRAHREAITAFGDGDFEVGRTRLIENQEWMYELAVLKSRLYKMPKADETWMALQAQRSFDETSEALYKEREALHQRRFELLGAHRDAPTAQALEALEGETVALQVELEALYAEKDRLLFLKALVTEADEVYRERHQPDLLKTASRYLSAITGARYKQIVSQTVSGETRFFVGTTEGLRAIGENFSRGTVQQLYFAFRLALIEQLDPHGKLPLVLDETFVNWDSRRIDNTVKLLETIGETRQIFVLTCQSFVAEAFPNATQVHLEEGL